MVITKLKTHKYNPTTTNKEASFALEIICKYIEGIDDLYKPLGC